MELFNISTDKVNDKDSAQILEIYKVCVEQASHISSRRDRANGFFVSINTAVIGFTGLAHDEFTREGQMLWIALMAMFGIIICILWLKTINSYRTLNSCKFRVIQHIEKVLPVAPFRAEWNYAGKGVSHRTHRPFTHVERLVPIFMMGIYGAILLLFSIIPVVIYVYRYFFA